MFQINSWWLPLILRVRFTRIFMWLEHTGVAFMAWLVLGGNTVDYTQIRCDAYHLRMQGYDVDTIAHSLRLPVWLVANWESVWLIYDKAVTYGEKSTSCERC